MEEIPILRVVVGKCQVQMEQDKIKVVKEWKTPTKIKEVENFLEFVNFYKRFIQNFSHMVKLLNKLKRKKEWTWTEEHQQTFEELKEKIMSQPVLSLLKREDKFRVETDALGHAIGEILSQEQEWTWKSIAFLSRIMQLAERNYEIWTDHENLKYFREPHKLNRWQARWYLKLQDYDFILWHISGKTNTKADILSRKD